ncbi:MAG: sulfotransferase family protein, partial [Rhodanobacteraceae bacterium]
QLSARGIRRDAFLSGLGDAVDRMILDGCANLETASRVAAEQLPAQTDRDFAISRDLGQAKSRWVDGTPEYSLEIPALLFLFPKAQFVHILRDADSVAASLLAFRDEAGRAIVASAEEAYAYWMRTVQACVVAEQALGPGAIHRVRHADLVAEGERTLRGILGFLGEPFEPACLEPLTRRINSSFAGKARPSAPPAATSTLIEQARRLSATLLASPQSTQADVTVRKRWEAEFNVRARTLQENWEAAQRMLLRTRLVLGTCGILLACNGAAALAVWLLFGDPAAAIWLAWACAAAVVYLWLRRAGVRAIAERALARILRSRGKADETGSARSAAERAARVSTLVFVGRRSTTAGQAAAKGERGERR